MKWLKLDCDFRNDPKILSLSQRFGGQQACSFWTLLLTYVGSNGMPNCEIHVTPTGPHSLNLIASFLHTKPKVALTMLSACAQVELIKPERWENDTVISIPNMLKRVDDYTRKVRTLSVQSPKIPPVEQIQNRTETDSAIESASEFEYSADFEFFFWVPYPKKTGKGKAFEEWHRLKPSNGTREKIKAAVTAASKTAKWNEDGGRYIPNPATFLHQRRWDDETGKAADVRPKLVF